MKPATVAPVCLLLFVLYCLDVAWKFPQLKELASRAPFWAVAGALTVRFAYMGGLLGAYVYFRRKAKLEESKS